MIVIKQCWYNRQCQRRFVNHFYFQALLTGYSQLLSCCLVNYDVVVIVVAGAALHLWQAPFLNSLSWAIKKKVKIPVYATLKWQSLGIKNQEIEINLNFMMFKKQNKEDNKLQSMLSQLKHALLESLDRRGRNFWNTNMLSQLKASIYENLNFLAHISKQ